MRTLIVLLLAASTAAAQQTAKWRLLEEWRVGGEVDGPHSFPDTRGMALLPDGRIVLIDYKDAQLHILDAKGQPVRTVGRKGAGPGEFDRPNGLAVNAKGEILVNDPVGNNRFTLFATNGDFIRTIPIMNRWGYGYTWDAYFNAAGLLDEYVPIRKPTETTSIIARRIYSADFATIDTVLPPTCPSAGPPPDPSNFSYRFEGRGGSMVMGIPYVTPRNASVRTREGTRWSGVYPGHSKITRTPADKCEPNLTITLRGDRLAIPSAMRDSTIAMVKSNAARYSAPDPDFSKIPTQFPGFEALYLDKSGELWVERLVDTKRHRFEVYSPAGALIADVESPVIPRVGRPVIITDDRILCFVADEDDLVHLVSLRIVIQP